MRLEPSPRDRRLSRITIAFFALVLLPFTCVFPFVAQVNNPNENVRTYETMAIVEDHTFRIDRIVGRYGWVNDMASVPPMPDEKHPIADKLAKWPVVGGLFRLPPDEGTRHLFSVKAPATSYFGVPVYWAMTKIAPRFRHVVPGDDATSGERAWWFEATTFTLRLFSVQIPCFLFLVWLERWLRGVTSDPVLRLSAVAAAGLGTNYVGYALQFTSHAQFAICAFASFAIATRERALHPFDPRRRRLSRAFLSGLFAGMATLFEYHALPVSVFLTLYALTVFWRPLRLSMFALGGALNVIALVWFQWRCFRDPLTPGHKMSENPLYAHMLSQGLFGIGKPDFDVFGQIATSPTFGFFGTSPFMWLGLLAIPFAIGMGYGAPRARAQRRVATIAWSFAMIALWLTVSAAINWRGGWTVGPRYLGAAPPFFAYGAVCALEAIAADARLRRAIVRGVAGGAALASVVSIGIVGMHVNGLPEDIARPAFEFTLPMTRVGYVPRNVLDLFDVESSGWASTFVMACAVGATLFAALVPWRDRAVTWAARAATFVPVFAIAMMPATSLPEMPERADLGRHARESFASWWDFSDDRIDGLRERAERVGPRNPCAWMALARTEKLAGKLNDAHADEKKAGDPAPTCKGLGARIDGFLLRHASAEDAPKDPPPPPPAPIAAPRPAPRELQRPR